MGNCLVIQQDSNREIKITRVDGTKALKLSSAPSRLKVHAESLPGPLPVPGHGSSGVNKVPAAVADPDVVKVKLVISKLELKRMLDKEGLSLDDMVSLMSKEAIDWESGELHEHSGAWQPALASIPEGGDHF